ncbi:GntR family transcriptional regulator [Leifsonia sp. NPDC058230]|uniref:GntR family transcriptional regulator n=1 Tax=Leifsonia sp. NPDC058230 TaxID=3346391 RepID=UPI0036DB6BFD
MTYVLPSASLVDSLSSSLRRKIIAGEIEPEFRLTEAWVSERFEVARPTAKASLDRLISEGLLRRGPRRSSMVPRLSADDVSDIYFSRGPVESIAVSSLAATSTVPPQAERALDLMKMAAERSAHNDHTEADVDFHRSLVAAAASPRLQRMHQTVMGEAQLCIAQVRMNRFVDLQELTARHSAILDAIRVGDSDAAVRALMADLEGCRDTLLADVDRRRSAKPHDADNVLSTLS